MSDFHVTSLIDELAQKEAGMESKSAEKVVWTLGIFPNVTFDILESGALRLTSAGRVVVKMPDAIFNALWTAPEQPAGKQTDHKGSPMTYWGGMAGEQSNAAPQEGVSLQALGRQPAYVPPAGAAPVSELIDKLRYIAATDDAYYAEIDRPLYEAADALAAMERQISDMKKDEAYEVAELKRQLAESNSIEGRTCRFDGCQNLAQLCDGHAEAELSEANALAQLQDSTTAVVEERLEKAENRLSGVNLLLDDALIAKANADAKIADLCEQLAAAEERIQQLPDYGLADWIGQVEHERDKLKAENAALNEKNEALAFKVAQLTGMLAFNIQQGKK